MTSGMRARFDVGADGVATVADVCLGYGGMSFKTVSCPKTEALLIGKPWNDTTLQARAYIRPLFSST